MRERPNRTVSKTVVSFGHRGFKSHSLRHRLPGLPHRNRSIREGRLWQVAGLLQTKKGRGMGIIDKAKDLVNKVMGGQNSTQSTAPTPAEDVQEPVTDAAASSTESSSEPTAEPTTEA
jgi:hypothetical protein